MQLRQSIATPDRFDESVFKNKRRDLTKPFFPQLLASQVVPFDPNRQIAAFPSLPIAVTSNSSRDRSSNEQQLSLCHDQDEAYSIERNLNRHLKDEQETILSTEEIIESIEATDTLRDTCIVCNKQMRVEWPSLALATQVHIFSFFLQLQKYAEVVATTLKLTHQELEEIKSHMGLRKIYQAPLEDVWAYGAASSGLGSGIIDPDKINDVMDYLLFASRYEVTTDVDTGRGKQFLKQLGFADHMMDLFEDYGRNECYKQAFSTKPPSPAVQNKRRRSFMRNDLRVKTMQANLDKSRSTTVSAPPSITTFADRRNSRTSPLNQDSEQPKTKRICLSIDKNGLASIIQDRAAKDPLRRTASLPTPILKSTSIAPIVPTNRSISLGNVHLPRIAEKDRGSELKLPVLGYFKPTSIVSSRKSSLGLRSEAAGLEKHKGNTSLERGVDANDKIDNSVRHDDRAGQSAAASHQLMIRTNSNALVQRYEGCDLEEYGQRRGQLAEQPETPENRRTRAHTGDTTIDILSSAEAVLQQTVNVVGPTKICYDLIQDIVSPEQDAASEIDTNNIAEVIQRLVDKLQAGAAASKEHPNESTFSTAPSYSPISDQDPESLPSWARYDANDASKDQDISFLLPGPSPQLSFQRRAATEISQNKFLQNVLDVAARPIIGPPSAGKERSGSRKESPDPLQHSATHDFPKRANEKTFPTLSSAPVVNAHNSSSFSRNQDSKAVKSVKIHYPVASMISVDIPVPRLQNTNQTTPCPNQPRSSEHKQHSTTRETSQKQNTNIEENNSPPNHVSNTTKARADNHTLTTKANNRTSKQSSKTYPTSKSASAPKRSKTTNSTLPSQSKPSPQPTKHARPPCTSYTPSISTSKTTKRTTRNGSSLLSTQTPAPAAPTSTSIGPNTTKRRSDFGRKRGAYKPRKSTKAINIDAKTDEEEAQDESEDKVGGSTRIRNENGNLVEGVQTRNRGVKK